MARMYLLRRLCVVASLIGCGAHSSAVRDRARVAENRGDYFAAVEGYLYEQEHSIDSQYEQNREDANRAELAWIKDELAKLARDEPAVAYSKVIALQKVAKLWILGVDVDEMLTSALGEQAARMLPAALTAAAIAADPVAARDKALGLVKNVDTAHRTEAEAAYNRAFAELAAKEAAAGDEAARAGRMATAYFHHVRAEAYALGKPYARAEESNAIDAAVGANWFFDNPHTGCDEVDNAIGDYLKEPAKAGRKGTLHVTITTCGSHVASDEITDHRTDTKGVIDDPGHDLTIQHQTLDDHGVAHDVQGPHGKEVIHGIASTHDESVAVDTHRLKRSFDIHGTITATFEGHTTTHAFDYHDQVVSEEERGGGSVKSVGRGQVDGLAQADKERSAALSAIHLATYENGDARAKEIVEKAAAITDPDQRIETLLTAARAGELPKEATAELTAKFHDKDLGTLMYFGALSAGPVSPSIDESALRIPVARADEDAIRSNNSLKPFIDARHPGGAIVGDFEIAPMQQVMDNGSSQYGAILGFQVWARNDPGPTASGVTSGIGWMMRAGYSNAVAFEGGIPLSLGYRSHGIGVAAIGEVGLNRFGTDGEAPLHVNGELYVGYGGALSVVTTSIVDVSASYLKAMRSTTFEDDETMAVTGEDRYELRASLVQPAHLADETIAKSLVLRYSSFSGPTAPFNGHIVALWLTFGTL